MIEASTAGNVSKVLTLIDKGANVNQANEYGYTPLTATPAPLVWMPAGTAAAGGDRSTCNDGSRASG